MCFRNVLTSQVKAEGCSLLNIALLRYNKGLCGTLTNKTLKAKFYFKVLSDGSWKNISWQKYFQELRLLGNITVLIQIKFKCMCISSFSQKNLFPANYTFYYK